MDRQIRWRERERERERKSERGKQIHTQTEMYEDEVRGRDTNEGQKV